MRTNLYVCAADGSPPGGLADGRWLPLGDLANDEKPGTQLVRAYLGHARMPRGRTVHFFADVDSESSGAELISAGSLAADERDGFWLLFEPVGFGGRAFRTAQPANRGQGSARPHEPHPGRLTQPDIVGLRLTAGPDGYLVEK